MDNPTLTLTDLLLLRKWLRRCYETSRRKNNDRNAAELTTLGQKISAMIDATPTGGNRNARTPKERTETASARQEESPGLPGSDPGDEGTPSDDGRSAAPNHLSGSGESNPDGSVTIG